MRPIVRWGLEELGGVLVDAGVGRPLLVASRRSSGLELPVPVQGVWSQVPSADLDAAAREASGCDGLLALGGGSAIDLAKAISAATGLPVVSIPTTYSGAEWTGFFGVRDERRLMRGGGAGAHLAGIVYEPRLTLDLPREPTGGTALNALAHCAEALYVHGHNTEADAEALAGAPLISEWLPRVLEDGRDLEARTRLLEGAAHAGAALGGAGLALGHALAQALGGRYGLPHGAMNALCLPPAIRFNEPVAGEAVARLAEAMGVDDAAARAEELSRLTGFGRLRDFGVPREDLPGARRGGVATERRAAESAPRRPGRDPAAARVDLVALRSPGAHPGRVGERVDEAPQGRGEERAGEDEPDPGGPVVPGDGDADAADADVRAARERAEREAADERRQQRGDADAPERGALEQAQQRLDDEGDDGDARGEAPAVPAGAAGADRRRAAARRSSAASRGTGRRRAAARRRARRC